MPRVIALLVVAAVASVAPAAVADEPAYPSITSLRVGSIAVSDQSCQRIPVTVRLSRSTFSPTDIDMAITAGGQPAGELHAVPDGRVVRDHLQWCPDSGLGRYRAGPTKLWGDDSLGSRYLMGIDQTTSSFYARRFSRTTVRHVDGSSLAVTVRAYSLTQRRYVGVSDVRVELRSGSKVVDRARTAAGGQATLKGEGTQVVAVPTATIAGSHHSA